MSIEVSQRVEFECSYIFGTELNAHRYKFEVTVIGPQREEDNGIVIDFKSLKNYMNSVICDHAFLYQSTVENPGKTVAFILARAGVKCVGFPFMINAENMCKYFVQDLQSILNEHEPGVTVVSAKLRETNDSYTSWSLNS